MRRIVMAMVCGLVMFVTVLGCRTRQPNLKPPPEPQSVHLPPPGDPRYASPSIPKEALKNRTNPYQGLGSIQGPPGPMPGPMSGPSFGPTGIGGGYRP